MKINNYIIKEHLFKRNIIKIVKHHRKYCEGESCDISLSLLLEVAIRAGIIFTDEEKKLFV